MDLGDLWTARTTALHRRTTWGTHVRAPLTLAQAHRCSLSPHFCLTRLTPFSPEVRSGIKDVLMKTIQENRAHPSSGWGWGGGRPFSSVFAQFHHLKQHSGPERTFFNVKVILRNGWRLDGSTLPLRTVEKQRKCSYKELPRSRIWLINEPQMNILEGFEYFKIQKHVPAGLNLATCNATAFNRALQIKLHK